MEHYEPQILIENPVIEKTKTPEEIEKDKYIELLEKQKAELN